MPPLAILGGLGLASAGIGAGASLSAAGTQASAAEQAQALQAQEAQNALNFQEQQFNTEQGNIAPFLQAGQGAVRSLSSLIPQLTAAEQAYPGFQAPTAAEAAATPGYQFTLGQGTQALQNSAAARGGLLSGNTGEALQQYGQGLASTTYGDVYNRALQQYQQAYGQFQNLQANQYNRLASLAGVGQVAAGQAGSTGQAAASNVGNINLTTGAQQGQALQNAGAANASGYVGVGNAASGGIGNLTQYLTLQQLLGQQGNASSTNNPGGFAFNDPNNPLNYGQGNYA
jgi:hypothetical protein